ncbi:hypothetical protein COOONC_15660 [Cooperia oncophora]
MDADQCQTVLVHLPNHSVVYDFFREVHLFYKPIHTYLSIIMCIFGTVANFCNIVVLTREVHLFYKPIHTYLSIIMCIFGTVANFCNIVVLTR